MGAPSMSGGGISEWQYIDTFEINGATNDIPLNIPRFTGYKLNLRSLVCSTAQAIRARVSVGGVFMSGTSDYIREGTSHKSGEADWTISVGGTPASDFNIAYDVFSGSGSNLSGEIILPKVMVPLAYPIIYSRTQGNHITGRMTGRYEQSALLRQSGAKIDGIRLYPDTGIITGTIDLYGVR